MYGRRVARGDHGGRSGATRRRTGFEGRRKALPADARRQNRSLLLRALFHAGPMSRADLARASGLTPTTVSNVIGEFVAEGMIEEAGRTLSGSVGKPATLVSVVADARHVVLHSRTAWCPFAYRAFLRRPYTLLPAIYATSTAESYKPKKLRLDNGDTVCRNTKPAGRVCRRRSIDADFCTEPRHCHGTPPLGYRDYHHVTRR